MAYKNGSYYCDYCGVKKGPVDGWKVGNSGAICPKCQMEMKVLKLQEEELKRRKREDKESKRNNTYSSGSSGWEKFLVIMKWFFCFLWGGPYLAIQGYKTKNRFWLISGIEFTVVIIIFAILVNLMPDFTNSTEPMHIALTYIFGILFVVNIVGLIVYWVKYREE